MLSHYLLKKKKECNFRFKINETHVCLHISLKFYLGKFYVLGKIIIRESISVQVRVTHTIFNCWLPAFPTISHELNFSIA